MANEPIKRAIAVLGSRKALIEIIGCGRSFLSQLESNKKRLPVKKVLLVEEKTGVSRHDLRPDIFGVV